MKSARHEMILDLIAASDIETQEALTEQLRRRGIKTTQATVSRDIKELHLLKVMSAGGVYKYAASDHREQDKNDRFIRIFSESVLSVACSDNLIVIKTLTASANAAAEAVDSLKWPEILGTLAGDNTILVVVRSDRETKDVAARFKAMMRED